MSIMMDESASQERIFVGRSGSVSKLYLLIWKKPNETEYVHIMRHIFPFYVKGYKITYKFQIFFIFGQPKRYRELEIFFSPFMLKEVEVPINFQYSRFLVLLLSWLFFGYVLWEALFWYVLWEAPQSGCLFFVLLWRD